MEHLDEQQLYKLVGSSLKSSRQKLGITQDQLAQKVAMLRTSVTNIEAGNQRPPLHVLYQLCQALGVEAKEILPLVTDILVSNEEIVDVEFGGKQFKVPSKTAEVLRKKYEQ